VVIYAALNGLDEEHRQELRILMGKWTAEHSENPPDVQPPPSASAMCRRARDPLTEVQSTGCTLFRGRKRRRGGNRGGTVEVERRTRWW